MGQCEDLEKTLKDEYGDDYVDKAKASSTTMTALLKTIVSSKCEGHFNYSQLVSDFCRSPENVFSSIGGRGYCKDYDTDGSKASSWCLTGDRMKSESGSCNKTNLKSSYDYTAKNYCKKNPQDKWCKCYNVSSGVCYSNENAYGCKEAIGNLKKNKKMFKDGYDILMANAHCRLGVCDRPEFRYVPRGALNSCKNSYRFCDQDIDIRSKSNGDIVMACNAGMDSSDLPEWWDEEDEEDGDSSWIYNEDRKFPFDTFPLNKLPITEIPDEFDWDDDNVQYLTYGGIGSCVLCICCIFIIMMIMRNLKKK